MSDLFLSHSSADVTIARELRIRLEASGYSCFTAPDDVTGRGSWTEQIVEAIDRCRVLVVLISHNALRSQHVSKEVGLAVERSKPLLPVRVEDVLLTGSLAYLLHLVQWVDAFPGRIDLYADLVRQRVEAILDEDHSAVPEDADEADIWAGASRNVSSADRTDWAATTAAPHPIADPRSRSGANGRMALRPVRIGLAVVACAALLALGFVVGTFLIP